MELINTSEKRIGSREIASMANKTHANVLKAIRQMEKSWVKVAGVNFYLGYYYDANNQKRPEYFLNKRESLYVATKFNDEARARLVIRWEELEKSNIPKTYSEALQLAANQAKLIEAQNTQLKMKDKEIELEREKRLVQQQLAEVYWDRMDRDDLIAKWR